MPHAAFPLAGSEGATVIVQVDEPEEGLVRVSRAADGLLKAGQTFQDALKGIEPVARAVLERLEALAPQEVEVEMGFKLTAEAGVVLTKAGGDAHLVVKLVWKERPKEPGH